MEDIQKRYYTISEVSVILGVNASLIRFWEKEFPQIKPKKGKKGNRLFTPSDLEVLKRIFSLVKQKGYTLEGARKALKNGSSETSSSADVVMKLTGIRQKLQQLLTEYQ